MNGKIFYFAIAALFGSLFPHVHLLFLLEFMCVYSFFLLKIKRFSRWQVVVVISIFAFYVLIAYHTNSRNISVIPETASQFLLEFNGDAKVDGDLFQIAAVDKNYKEKLIVRYYIKTQQEKEALSSRDFYGYLCKVTGELKKPAPAKNPNAFDYREYLAMKNIHWIAETKENPLVNCTPQKPTPIGLIKKIRFYGIRHLETHAPSQIASLSAALIFGDRTLLDPDLLSDFQQTGIVHLLAISGLHVSLLVGMVFYLGIRIGLTRQLMTNLLLLILPVYCIMTGGSPSVIRAVMMIYLVLLSVKWKNRIKLNPLDAISLVLMFYLFASPLIIVDVGFQLSFTVSFAIILSAPSIMKRYKQSLAQMLAISLISQLAAMPLLLFHFFELSLIGIIANLIYIPLFSFVFLPGLYLLYFIELIFGTVPPLFTGPMISLINLSNSLISRLAAIPIAHFVPGRPNRIFLILYIVGTIAIFLLWESHIEKRKQCLMVLVCFLFSFQSIWSFVNPKGEVTMIDVGQGDSILIHQPHGQGNYLIDTGGVLSFTEEEWQKRAKPYETGRDVVVPFLKGKGYTTIDKLILTHGDTDHIGGAVSIIRELKVKQILLPSVTDTSETERIIIREAAKKRIPVIKVSEGVQWKTKTGAFYVLSPVKNFSGERNSGSVTLLAKIGGLTWFFGGDLDQQGEERIIGKYPNLRVDVLKAGHHGSKTSSADDFIRQVKPKVTLISAGEHNRFGHPHQEVLDKLRKINSIIYRTDQQGAITYHFFREEGTFSTFLP